MRERASWKNPVSPVSSRRPLSEEQQRKLDTGYNTEQSEILRPYIPGPIIWEQQRPECDETNLLLSGLTDSHCNSNVLNGEDSGDMVDEYQQNYMTKEGAGLKNAAGVMLTALEDVLKYPSVAEDSGTPMRTAQYLATRTVNAFGGAHEWPLSLMVYALLGNKSYVSSETLWYVFPRTFVAELQNQEVDAGGSDQDASAESESSCASETDSIADMLDFDVLMSAEQEQSSMSSVTQTIEELANSAELPQSTGLNDQHSSGGARAFKIDGKTVFVTEVESYKFRGKWFLD
ncbi:hypothetical protein DVH05_004993 [Phytophthora capsici]|nr:hypothetical protein DVH05_004993 [Phytophthora capsici]